MELTRPRGADIGATGRQAQLTDVKAAPAYTPQEIEELAARIEQLRGRLGTVIHTECVLNGMNYCLTRRCWHGNISPYTEAVCSAHWLGCSGTRLRRTAQQVRPHLQRFPE